MSPIPCLQWFNSAGLDLKPPGSFGTLGNGILREPGMFAWDMGAFKKISLTGNRVNMQFRARFFNIFNHPRVLPTIAMSGAGFCGTAGRIRDQLTVADESFLGRIDHVN